ncbi:rho family-interacting cell polarization regulator 2-like isoform X2 [Watersipora subatra]
MSFAKSRTASGSAGNLYRSQSMASLGGDKLVLGESFRSSYGLSTQRNVMLKELGLNSKSISKIPKTPRPTRTTEMFEAVIKGLRDHVRVTTSDQSQALDDSRSKSTSSNRLKALERHKKKLEYLLSKVEELYDHYQVQNQMREGTKALSKAYESSTGLHRKDSIQNVHYGFKECSKTMCAIEAQLESMLGQFHCEMKGIMGFARVMPGDSFEVNIRHGNQKWKTKGYVSKDNEQSWDQDKRTLTIQINSSLNVKVFESRRLSKTNLGEKHCDVIGLFAANPQILTVNVNDIGTIKLNILVQWMPLANFTEQMKYYDPPPRDSISHRSPAVVVPLASESLESSTLPRLTHKSPAPEVVSPMNHKPDLLCDMVDDTAKGENVLSLAAAIEEEEETEVYHWPADFETAVKRVRQALEEYQQHSSALKSLYDLMTELDSVIEDSTKRRSFHRGSFQPDVIIEEDEKELSRCQSNISLAIETAFDFLNCEDCETDSESELEMGDELSPTSTFRSMADSGIESLLLTRQSSSQISSYSTGNIDLDTAIVQHCALIEVLLENLDNVGLLKSKERSALSDLKQQKNIFSKILYVTKQLNDKVDLRIDVTDLLYQIIPGGSDVHEFWLSNTKPDTLCMSIAEFSKALYRSYNTEVEEQYSVKSDRAFNCILKKITKGSKFSMSNQSHLQVTLFQFTYAILESRCQSMHFYVHEVASELWLMKQLKSGNSSLMIRSVQSLKGATPSLDIVKILVLLINSPTADVSKTIGEYWRELAHDRKLKDAIIPAVLSCLEESRPDIRIGACNCLERLNATNTAQELLYVAQADSSRSVQSAARRALTALNTTMDAGSL